MSPTQIYIQFISNILFIPQLPHRIGLPIVGKVPGITDPRVDLSTVREHDGLSQGQELHGKEGFGVRQKAVGFIGGVSDSTPVTPLASCSLSPGQQCVLSGPAELGRPAMCWLPCSLREAGDKSCQLSRWFWS